MGAWDTGSFDNDDAADWVLEFEEAKSLGPILVALSSVENAGDYLEAPDCSIAIAAAEVVAAIYGKGSEQLSATLKDIVAGVSASADQTLKMRAGSAVLRIKTDSELKDLWEESESLEEWTKEIDNLLERLQ